MTIRHPEDVRELKAKIPALANLSDEVVQLLYSNWSEETYAAGWLLLDEEIIQRFAAHITENPPSTLPQEV